MMYNIDDAVKALSGAGVPMSRQNFSQVIVPMLLDTGMAQRLGKGKRSTVVIPGHSLLVLNLYLLEREKGVRHQVERLRELATHWKEKGDQNGR